MSSIREKDSVIHSFAPIVDSRSKLLILGTMPGKESLRMNAYYAHPQNAFWKIILNLLDLPFSADHHERRAILLQHEIAVWDVLSSCERSSSLDNDIRLEQPNDLRSLLSSYPGISRIFFNGKVAARYFGRYFPDIRLINHVLPSSSPAHAIKLEQKQQAWQVIKTF